MEEKLQNELNKEKINLKKWTLSNYYKKRAILLTFTAFFSGIIIAMFFQYEIFGLHWENFLFNPINWVFILIFSILAFTIVFTLFIIFEFKKYCKLQKKLNNINWLLIYNEQIKEGNLNFYLHEIYLTKLHISYSDLKLLILKKKINEISLKNYVIIEIKNINLKIIYESLIFDQKEEKLFLIIKMDFSLNKDENTFKDFLNLKRDVIIYNEKNRTLDIKVLITDSFEFLNEFAFPHFLRTINSIKISKNLEKNFNKVIGQFYSIKHSRLNYIRKYFYKVDDDLREIDKLLKLVFLF